MTMVLGSAGELSRIAYGIMDQNREVTGKYSDNAHLYHDEVEDDGSTVRIRFWSGQGIVHNCKITVAIRAAGAGTCDVTISHCGDAGVRSIERKMWNAFRRPL